MDGDGGRLAPGRAGSCWRSSSSSWRWAPRSSYPQRGREPSSPTPRSSAAHSSRCATRRASRRAGAGARNDGMLKELTRADWLSILNLPERRVPLVLLLRGTRNLTRWYRAAQEHFTNVLELGTPNGILDDLFVANLGPHPIAYASVYGAPMASEVTHVFGVLGTRLVVQIGNGGALRRRRLPVLRTRRSPRRGFARSARVAPGGTLGDRSGSSRAHLHDLGA